MATNFAAEAVIVDWLTWPAELLLSAGGIIASWFVGKDAPSFPAIQMGFGLLVLAGCSVAFCIFANVGQILAVAFTN